MSDSEEDNTCLDCEHKKLCGKSTCKKDGKPNVNCFGYSKQMTDKDKEHSIWEIK